MASTDDIGDYPNIVVAGVYPQASIAGTQESFLLASQGVLKRLSSATLKDESKKKNIQQIFKETVSNMASLSRHSLNIGNDSYLLYVFPATEDEVALFLCEASDSFFQNYDLNKDEPALSLLPFLDGALSYFLSRSEIYGPEFAKKKKHTLQPSQDATKMSRRVSIGETFSLEEVFRTFDTEGAGFLTLDNFRSGLKAAGLNISDKDAALVFNAMAYRTTKPKTPNVAGASGGDEQKVVEDDESGTKSQTTVSYFQFYSFFDGSRLNKISSRAQASPVVMSPSSMQTATFPQLLGTVNEDVTSDNEPIEVESESDGESKKAEKLKLPVGAANKVMQKHILKVKQAIFECLNMGSDHTLFSDRYDATTSPVKGKHGAHARSRSIDIGDDSTNKIDVEKALTKINNCDALKQLMQANIYLCPTQQDMVRWDNRYRAHNIRIQNFREILNGALATQMRKLKQELADVEPEVEVAQFFSGLSATTTPSGKHKAQKSSTANLQLTEDTMKRWSSAQNISSPGRSGHTRSLSRRHSRGASGISVGSDIADDLSSVDSDAGLIYVPGKELKGKEMEDMLSKFKLKNKECKALRKKLKASEVTSKNQKMQYDKDLKKTQSKLEKATKELTELKNSNADVRSKLRSMAQKRPSSRNINLKASDADSQREISKLNREVKKLKASLEAETVTKEASQERVRQLLKAQKRLEDDTGNENGTISQRKIARLEKDVAKKEDELNAKRKKLDEMFIKLKTYESRLNTLLDENSANKAKVQGLNKRIQEIESEKEKLQARADEKSRIAGEVRELTKKVDELKEKLTRIRARNTKLKLKIERLMNKLKDLEKHQSESTRLRKELLELEREKRKIMQSKDVNSKEMQQKLAELEAKMREKEQELEQAMAELDKFKEELSAEYASVKELQDALEERDQVINDKEEEISVQIARLEALVEHNEKLAAQYKRQLQKSEKQKDELHAEFSKLQSTCDDAKSEINDLNAKLLEKENELKLLRVRQGEAEKKLQNQEVISNELQNKLDKISGLEADLAMVRESELTVRSEYEVKCQDFDQLLEKWKAMQKEQEINTQRIKDLQSKNKKLESKKLKENDENAVKLKKFEMQVDQIEKLKKEISMQKTTIQRWKGKYEAEKEAGAKAAKDLSDAKIECEDLQAQVDKLKKQNKEYKKKLGLSGVGKDKDKNAMALMEQNVDTLTEKVRNRDFEIRKLKNQLKAVGKGGSLDTAELEHRAKQFEQEAKRQEEEANEAKEKLANKEAELDVLKKQVEDKNEQISQLHKEKEELEIKLDKVNATEENSESENRRLSTNITKKTSEIATLRKKILDLETEIKRLKEVEMEKAKIETEYEDLKAQLDEFQADLDQGDAP